MGAQPKKELKLFVGGKPVLEIPEIAALWPRRSNQAMAELQASIYIHGQEGRCLFLDRGDAYAIIDGHDTCRAIATLQLEGDPVEVLFDLWQPKETAPESVLEVDPIV